MKLQITITGSPKEIAALVDELQERRAEYERKSQVNRILEAFRVRDSEISTSKVGNTLKEEKIGTPAEATHKIYVCAITEDMLADLLPHI